MENPTILITNDDGIFASGIRNLASSLKGLGRLVVVAPDKPQSGMGHAITTHKPLRIEKVENYMDFEVEAWQCNGTPADCVKIARNVVLKCQPDLCVSGVNHGSNASINVVYSGTMSAAMEAALIGIPAVGFSLLDLSSGADFTVSKIVTRVTVKKMLQEKLPPGFLLNINIPKVAKKDFKGIKVCRQAKAYWQEHFDERETPYGQKYYWMTGEFINEDKEVGNDILALEQGYATVVPIKVDFTNHELLPWLKKQTQILSWH